jgi:predicted negative regulator of RcsB-dependent stress response
MTNPSTEPVSPVRQPKAESFVDWFHVNSRWVGVGAVAVLVAVVAAWYVPRAKLQKNQNADRQLLLAKQSLAPGNANVPLAEVDLKKVADRYEGTSAGAEAAMLLAQLKLEKGDNQGAATYLEGLTARLKSGPDAVSATALLGDAYSQLAKYAEAAAQYERAAEGTSMPNEKTFLMMKAGHAYMAAGKSPEARKIWQTLANQSDNPSVAAEARVRLGELSAQSARG